MTAFGPGAGVASAAEKLDSELNDRIPAVRFVVRGAPSTPSLMVDAIRHGARAFSQRDGISEEEALSRIWQGVDAERDCHTTPLDTVQNYEKSN